MQKIIVVITIVFSLVLGGFLGIKGGESLSYLMSKAGSQESAQTNPGISDSGYRVKPTLLNLFSRPKAELVSTSQNGNSYKIPAATLPSSFKNFFSDILVGGKSVKAFKRSYDIEFSTSDEFQKLEGITCFRGNNYRDSASYGNADVKLHKLEKVWSIRNGALDEWSGTGWNGQPSIVKWSPEVKGIMNINASKKNKKDLKEVIYATLDGKIYFLDLDDGKQTRAPINVGSPHKGSVVIDPRGYPLLYAGQGIPTVHGKTVPIKYRIFSLIDQKLLYSIDGMDKDAFRRWGAFDSGAMIDSKTDTFIECGENGIIYSGKLNTRFDPVKKAISIKPDLVKYRYKSPYSTKIGIENSPAIYKNYIYFADNSGLFQCVDLNTLKPVWLKYVNDDTDSSTAIEDTGDGAFLYTACEVDHQGAGGSSYIRKLDALTGREIWKKAIACGYDPKTNGGALASPVIGKGDIQGTVIYNIAKTGKNKNQSTLIAMDSKTGKTKWLATMKYYGWSSPVAIYTPDDKSYIVICDSVGNMMLYEGSTGKLLDTIQLGANIEASPAVYDNMIVVGTRGCKIYGIRIK